MLLVAGTTGIDRIETPDGTREECLGGSAIHFAFAASLFGPVRVLSVAGQDFPPEALRELDARKIDTTGISIAAGKTFRWSGRYFDDMDRRETLATDLNVFAEWQPEVPAAWRDTRTLFLANASPRLQLRVLDQLPHVELAVCDTMDLWIRTEPDELAMVLRRVQGALVNESEALMLTREPTLMRAGAALLESGPRFAVVKKGSHGSLLFSRDGICALPAFPIARVYDPTGAGDSFAGGFLGYLNAQRSRDLPALKRALAYGTCVASFNVEDFGCTRLSTLARRELAERFKAYKAMLSIR